MFTNGELETVDTILRAAMKRGTVYEKDGFVWFGNTRLGTNTTEASEYLGSNTMILDSVKKTIR